jgi:hypothetical protein
MKTRVGVSVITACVMVLFLFARVSASSADADLFPVPKGALWEFKGMANNVPLNMTATITTSKTENGKTTVEMRWTQNGQVVQDETYIVSSTEVTRTKAGPYGGITSNPPVPIIKYPMTVGKTWTYTGVAAYAGHKSNVTGKMKVAAIETIKTPAGEFKAYRLSQEVTDDSSAGATTATNSFWFAPGVGIVQQKATVNLPSGQSITVSASLTKYKLK